MLRETFLDDALKYYGGVAVLLLGRCGWGLSCKDVKGEAVKYF